MRTIRISAEVWEAISSHGKFGETPDDVLRRVFDIRRRGAGAGRRRQTKRAMSARVDNGRLIVEFSGGPNRSWSLPVRSDKLAIREVRDKAVAFARDNEATPGQESAVKKALTANRYHVAK